MASSQAQGFFSRSIRFVRLFAAIKLDKYGGEWLSRKIRREGWTKNTADEIELQVKTQMKKDEIIMEVDDFNTFVLCDENKTEIHTHQLPVKGNFEKATIKAKFEDGLVTVNMTNFKRKQVKVPYCDE